MVRNERSLLPRVSTLGIVHVKDRLRLLRNFHHQAACREKADDEIASQTSAPKEERGVEVITLDRVSDGISTNPNSKTKPIDFAANWNFTLINSGG
jgi:hypothetical protein